MNDIEDIKEFDNDPEFTGINPNASPWLRNTLFYQTMFDNKGKKRNVSGDVKNKDGTPLSDQKVRIEIADLSCLETVSKGRYDREHPKSLSAKAKLVFDTLTLFEDGYIEIPRPETSSSIIGIKLNSYDAKMQGTNFVPQFLPIDATSTTVFNSRRFRSIMAGYLVGELQKMRWYYDSNPNHKLASTLNTFAGILTPENVPLDGTTIGERLIAETKKLTGNVNDKIAELVKSNIDEINGVLTKYFQDITTDLWQGNNGVNYMSLSPNDRKVIKSMLDLYQDKSKLNSADDIKREKELSKALEKREESSSYQTSKETAFLDSDESLKKVAAAFVANQFILNVEYHNWFMGDNYLFSNPFKRGKVTTNTGTLGIVSPHTSTMLNRLRGESMHSMLTGNKGPKDFRYLRTSTLKDAVISSRYFDMNINDIINFEKQYNPSLDTVARKKELEKDFDAYLKVNAGDGQAKMGLDSYRIMRNIYGNWSNKDEKEYRRQLAILRVHRNLYKNDA